MQAKVKKSLQLVPGASIFYPRYPSFRPYDPLGLALDRKSNKKVYTNVSRILGEVAKMWFRESNCELRIVGNPEVASSTSE
jgi:hypothetical protein